MAMPIPAPDLDTRTWAELVREARLRIPRYTPEWTDLNDSDPGMTLVQLFAWLTETLLYQMNRLPDRNYVELLNLMGIEPRPARAAAAQLSFSAGSAEVPRQIPRGTAILSQGTTPEGVPILFETSEPLPMIRGPLVAVQAKVGVCFVDLTEANTTAGDLYYPFGRTPQPGADLYLGFGPLLETQGEGETSEDDEPIDRESNLFHTPLGRGEARDRIDPEQPTVHSPFPDRASLRVELELGDFTGAPPVEPPELEWSVSIGRGRWRPLEVEDGSEGFTRSGTLWLENPRRARRTVVGEVDEALFYLRCRVRRWGTAVAQPVDAILPNTIPARALETVRDQVLGTSTGLADQRFSLDRSPIESHSLRLRVEPPIRGDGTTPGSETWRQIPDLFAAGPLARVYSLDPATGIVVFGDGRHGRIPEPDATVVAQRYRFGGGAAGNVVANSIDTPLDNLGDLTVENWRPAVGGLDQESLEEAKRRAPLTLRNRDRAVTAEDYSALATQVGGVAQALTLPCFDPDHPHATTPGAVTVVVLPDTTTAELPWLPRPSETLLDEVYQQLMPRRMVTTELIVTAPRFHELEIEVAIWIDAEVGIEAATRALREAIDTALGVHGQRIGQELYPARFYTIAQQVPGVLAVRKLRISRDGHRHHDFERPLDPGPDGFFVVPPQALQIETSEAPETDHAAFHYDGAPRRHEGDSIPAEQRARRPWE